MTSNVLHLQKAFHPAAKLAMGRTMIKSGRKRGDLGLVRAGKELFDKSNAELDGQSLPTSDQTSSPSPAPRASPNLSCPAPIASAR